MCEFCVHISWFALTHTGGVLRAYEWPVKATLWEFKATIMSIHMYFYVYTHSSHLSFVALTKQRRSTYHAEIILIHSLIQKPFPGQLASSGSWIMATRWLQWTQSWISCNKHWLRTNYVPFYSKFHNGKDEQDRKKSLSLRTNILVYAWRVNECRGRELTLVFGTLYNILNSLNSHKHPMRYSGCSYIPDSHPSSSLARSLFHYLEP